MQNSPRHGTRGRSVAGYIGLALACLCADAYTVALVRAHDLEKTLVLVTFTPGGRYQVDVLNEPNWLWGRLTPAATSMPTHQERDRQLQQWTDRFLEGVMVAFDGEPVPIERVEYVPPRTNEASQVIGGREPGLMRLTGAIPRESKTFQFAYAFVVDPFPLMVRPSRGTPITLWATPNELSAPLLIAQIRETPWSQVVRQYLLLGFTHILPKGLDHILFVIGLFLLSTSLRVLLVQVTAFTVAHTFTLGLTIYGVFSLSRSIVEPLIALSIAYVAIENVLTSELKRSRIALVFAFGLLHGMGFAGVLADVGLPRSEFLTALLTFNMGVEAAQVTVMAMAFAALGAFRHEDWYRRRAVVPASLLIAAIALYWTADRMLGG